MTVFSYKIVQLAAYSEYDGKLNVVHHVIWSLRGDVGGEWNASTEIPYDPNLPFIQYENLQESEVISWIEQFTPADYLAEAKQNVEQQIAALATPPVVVNPLPWENNNAA